jgi:cellulose biosynthesis protein BcsQ
MTATAVLDPPAATDEQEATVFHRRARCRRHAFIGYKGGTAKSTCVLCTAEAAARRGLNVLVVDTDPQANATRRFRAEDPDRPTLADVLHHTHPVPITDAMTVCGWDTEWAARIHVVQAPSMAHLQAGAEQLEARLQEAHITGAVNRLRLALLGIPEGVYDLVLFDTAPNMGHGFDMVLAAMDDPDDKLWLCINPEFDSLMGGLKFQAHVRRNRALLGVDHLDVAGVLLTIVSPSDPLHASVLEQIDGTFPGLVVPDYLPEHKRMRRAAHEALPVEGMPELHRRRWTAKGEPPTPSFADRMELMTGAVIDAK